MSSTLADLQRLNIKKMEDAETPQDANIIAPSNEVSIIPSKHQLNDNVNDNSIKASNDATGEVTSEFIIIPSSTPSQKQGSHQASKPKLKKSAGNALSPDAPASSGSKAVRTALEAQIREHLIEQLMPQNGKGPVTRLNVEMPEDLHQQLKQHCVQTRTPIKGLINALIAWYLEAEGGSMSEAAEVVPGYHSAVNEIIEPDKVLVLTRYFVRRWMPALGDNGTRIVLALRSLGYYNRQTGEKRDGIEIDLPELAAMCGISVPTLKREFGERHDKSRAPIPGSLQNPALHQFIKKDRQYWRDPVTNRLLRTANIYRVMMDDPIHEDDLPKLQEVLVAREKGAQPSKAQNEPKPPKGRTSPVPSKAQNESEKNESESKATHYESKSSESESPNVESEPALIDDFSSLQKVLGTSLDAAAPDFLASLFSEEVSEKRQDILDKLLPDQWTELEAKARARVIAENRDPVRALAQKGKAFERVRAMMRQILREQA